MTDKKFTQKEVIKGLECCINDDCDNCPNGFGNCERNLAELSLDLIKRLKTRIVRYQLKNTNQRNALASLNKKVAEQKAEIERLTNKCEDCAGCNQWKCDCSNERAYAIEKFVNLIKRRLNCNSPRGAYLINIVDNLVKEMMEE